MKKNLIIVLVIILSIFTMVSCINKDNNLDPDPTIYTLTVTFNDNNGSVDINPDPLNTPGTGLSIELEYEEDTQVTLTAQPDPGYVLDTWGGVIGSANLTDETVYVTMTENKEVTISFVAQKSNTLGNNWVKTAVNSGETFISNFSGHTMTLWNNEIWIVGGITGETGSPPTQTEIYNNKIWHSANGVDWVGIDPVSADPINDEWVDKRANHTAFVYDNKLWIIGGNQPDNYGNNSDVWYTEDGETWTKETGFLKDDTDTLYQGHQYAATVIHNNKAYIVGGSGSTNGFNKVWYMDGTAGNYTWHDANPSGFNGRQSHTLLSYNGDLYVIGGIDGNGDYVNDVYKSSDNGASWTALAVSGLPSNIMNHSSVVFNNDGSGDKMWIIGGSTYDTSYTYLNSIYYSTDGASWVEVQNPTGIFSERRYLKSVALGNKVVTIGGSTYRIGVTKPGIFTSENMTDWSEAASIEERAYHSSIVFSDKMWIIGGYKSSTYFNDVWSSTDGETWSRATNSAFSTGRSDFAMVDFDGKMWVLGGKTDATTLTDEVYTSTDGITWTQETITNSFGARSGHEAIVFNNKIWVTGGYNGTNYTTDVYSSDATGLDFTQEITTGLDTGFTDHTMFVHNNKMWIVGGLLSGGTYTSAIYSSTDGLTWTSEGTLSSDARAGHSTCVYVNTEGDNEIYTMAGTRGTALTMNDVWFSDDGFTWSEKVTNDNTSYFTHRKGHTSVVYDNKLWVIFGMDGSSAISDIWYSAE